MKQIFDIKVSKKKNIYLSQITNIYQKKEKIIQNYLYEVFKKESLLTKKVKRKVIPTFPF